MKPLNDITKNLPPHFRAKLLLVALDLAARTKGKRFRQGDFANHLGVSAYHLSNILNGHAPMTEEVRKRIGRELGVRL